MTRPAAYNFDDKSHVRSTAKPRPSTADIAEVLARSQSRKEAAEVLGIPATTLERLCREQALVSLYEALAERGTARRGPRKTPKQVPVRRWSFYWRVNATETVCIWPERQVDAVTEQEALEVFMTKVARCMAREDISAVEVLT